MRKKIYYPIDYASRYVQITHFGDKDGVVDEVECLIQENVPISLVLSADVAAVIVN